MGCFTVHFRSFTLNFTQVKFRNVGTPQRVDFRSYNNLSSFKNAIVKLALL